MTTLLLAVEATLLVAFLLLYLLARGWSADLRRMARTHSSLGASVVH